MATVPQRIKNFFADVGIDFDQIDEFQISWDRWDPHPMQINVRLKPDPDIDIQIAVEAVAPRSTE